MLEKKTIEIDLKRNATYVVVGGEFKEIPSPSKGYGKQIINWQGGKPCNGSVEDSLKF